MNIPTNQDGGNGEFKLAGTTDGPGRVGATARRAGHREAPPSCHTGAQNAQPFQVLIDWVSCTFPDETPVETVLQLLGGNSGFVEMPRGFLGYRAGLVKGNVRVAYEGRRGMGVHVQISGQGCRELEADGAVTDWREYLAVLLAAGGRFSRLDVAVDDKSGYLPFDEIQASVESGHFVSQWRNWQIIKAGTTESLNRSNTVYLGSPSSEARLRIYDKAAQLGEGGHWIRVEFQTRDERATALAAMLSVEGLRSIAGVLRGYVDFKLHNPLQQQKTRWKTREWWADFLAHCAVARLATQPVERNLAKLQAWLTHQVAPSLAALLLAVGKVQDDPMDVLLQLVSQGSNRMRPWHQALIAQTS